MIRALLAALSFSVLLLATPALAKTHQPLSLSLIRAIRVSSTSISISFKTSEQATGEVAYTDANNSKFTLTDSVPQTDHLFTINELDPKHGYSFVLRASTDTASSNIYTLLLSLESIGAPGTSITPSVQVADATGHILTMTSATPSAPPANNPIAPWWVFALAFLAVVIGWVAYSRASTRMQ